MNLKTNNDAYRAHILYILPSSLRVEEELHRQLTSSQDKSLEGSLLIDYRMMTFLELTTRIYFDLKTGRKVIGSLGRRILLRNIVQALYEDLKQSYFGRLIHYPGFFDFLQSFLKEVKEALLTPETFRKVTQSFPKKFQELADIYDAYQEALDARALHDAQDRDRHVMEYLQHFPGNVPFLKGIEELKVDDIYDFNPIQFIIVRELARRIGVAEISFPYDFERADDIFRFVTRTVEQFEKLHDLDADLNLDFKNDELRMPELHQLLQRIIRSSSSIAYSLDLQRKIVTNGRIRIIEASSRYREIQEVAKEIRRLLHSGVNPGEIAILFRSLSSYMAIIEDIFDAYDLPYFLRNGSPLHQNPLMKTILTLLEIPLKQAPRSLMLKLVQSNYVDFQMGEDTDKISVEEAVDVILTTAVLDNRDDGWERGFRRLFARLHRKIKELSQKPDVSAQALEDAQSRLERVECVHRVVKRLLHRLFALDQRLTLSEFVERFVLLIKDLKIRERAIYSRYPGHHRILERDSFALKCLDDILDRLCTTYIDLSFSEETLTLEEFSTLLHDALQSEAEQFTLEKENLSSIYVLDLHQSRGLKFQYVFLVGLIEGEFPLSEIPDSIFKDSDRCEFNQEIGQKVFRLSKEKAEEEPLLFYLGIRSATERITFSYSTSNREGDGNMHRSFYLDEVMSLLDLEEQSDHPVVSRYPSTAVVPTFAEGFSPNEVLNRLCFNLWHEEDERPLPMEKLLTLEVFNKVLDHGGLRDALVQAQKNGHIEVKRQTFFETERAQDRMEKASVWTGQIYQRDLLSHLFVGSPHVNGNGKFRWSGSRLETYQQCSFRFFLSEILQIKPIEQFDIEIEANKQGSLIHELLEVFFHRVQKRRFLPLKGTNAEKEEMNTVAQEIFQRWETEEFIGHRGLWAIRKADLYLLLHQFIEVDATYQQDGFLPISFEYSFGSGGEGEPLVILDLEGDAIEITGKIDRIDIAVKNGVSQLLVLDYKNSKSDAHFRTLLQEEKIGDENFQIPIYLMAADQYVRKNGLASEICERYGTYYLMKAGKRTKSVMLEESFFALDLEKRKTLRESSQRNLADLISNVVSKAKNGNFHITPRSCTFCRYTTVCRYIAIEVKDEQDI